MSNVQTSSRGPLSGLNAVTLAGNIPGPVAASALLREGLSVVKVEGPAGDMLAQAHRGLYSELAQGQTVLTLDLRAPGGQQQFQALLADADLLLTSQRPAALARLGITREALAAAYPRLCWVEIVGDTEQPEVPGHDLTYQMEAGLVRAPQMPLTLLADLTGAEQAARAAVTLLLGRERGSSERHRQIGLKQAAQSLTLPLRHGLTLPGGWLSGHLPNYRIYPLKDGWVSVAALEPHFAQRFQVALGNRTPEEWFGTLCAAEVNRLAHELDLPLHAFQQSEVARV